MRYVLLIALALSCNLLSAAVSAAGGGSGGVVPQGEVRTKAKPAWVLDPTLGGKSRAVVLTWAAGADRETQRKARRDATERLRTAFKLPESAKAKDMDTWADETGAVFIHLVAR